jgi:hypothetical protein
MFVFRWLSVVLSNHEYNTVKQIIKHSSICPLVRLCWLDYIPGHEIRCTFQPDEISLDHILVQMFVYTTQEIQATANVEQKTHYFRVKENKIDVQFILIYFVKQPLYISAVSRPIIRRYNCVYITIGTYYYSFYMTVCCLGWIRQDNIRLSKKNKYQFLHTYGCTSWWWA